MLSQEEMEKAEIVFKKFDLDESSTLEVEEVKPMIEELTGAQCSEQEVIAACNEFDENGDGTISFDEFLDIYSFLTAFKQDPSKEESICYVYTAFGIKSGNCDDEDIDHALASLNIAADQRAPLLQSIKEKEKLSYRAFRDIVAPYASVSEEDEE